jgi:hypothetical protein
MWVEGSSRDFNKGFFVKMEARAQAKLREELKQLFQPFLKNTLFSYRLFTTCITM